MREDDGDGLRARKSGERIGLLAPLEDHAEEDNEKHQSDCDSNGTGQLNKPAPGADEIQEESRCKCREQDHSEYDQTVSPQVACNDVCARCALTISFSSTHLRFGPLPLLLGEYERCRRVAASSTSSRTMSPAG